MKNGLRRLRAMTRDEVSWRARAFARTQAQRVAGRVKPPQWDRSRLRHILAADAQGGAVRRAMDAQDWRMVHDALCSRLQERPSHFVLDHSAAAPLLNEVRTRWPGAAAQAAARANRILAGRYDILGYRDVMFGCADSEMNWHLDPVHDRQAPAVFWADVPYLDPAVGDHKIIWELNRHQHWLPLGRALWLTGDLRYRRAIIEQLESWLAANPPLVGINWASMLEIGLRAISWTWALHFLLATDRSPSSASPADPDRIPWIVDLLVALERQLTHVEQHLSYYFSPNTHLLGEALALYVVGLALPELAASGRWRDTGRRILLAEIDRQILPDGGHAERSTHYQRYTLDFYLFALLTATRARDTAVIPHFTGAVTRLAEFTRIVSDQRGVLPLIGDDDGGMLWPIAGRMCSDVRDSLALAALVLARPDLAPWEVPEEVFWLGGETAVALAGSLDAGRHAVGEAPSRTFHDAGYIVARDAGGGHAVFDAGRHGYMNAGHAHADALAITLSVENRPLLVDPGTSTYTMDRVLRDRMRSSMSHNTLIVDGRSQSMPSGPFQWRTRTDARLHASRHNAAFDWAEASHDGYAPLRHRRTLFRVSFPGWLLVDEILGDGRHTASAHWHFDPGWAVTVDAPGRLRAAHIDGGMAWLLSDAGAVRLSRGDEHSGLGWYAPIYGRLVPTWSAAVVREGVAPFSLVTWIGSATDDGPPLLERLTVTSDSVGTAIAARVTTGDTASVFLLQPGEPPSPHARAAAVLAYHTNGRALHYETRGDDLVSVDLVDATYLLPRREGWLSVEADEPIAELHIRLNDGVINLRSSKPPARMRLRASAIANVGTIRLNGSVTTLCAEGETVVIDQTRWSDSSRRFPPMPAAVAAGGYL